MTGRSSMSMFHVVVVHTINQVQHTPLNLHPTQLLLKYSVLGSLLSFTQIIGSKVTILSKEELKHRAPHSNSPMSKSGEHT